MANEASNGSKIKKLRMLFFAYSISIIDLMVCQPFHDYTRFVIYATIPLLAIYIISRNGIKSIIVNAASVIILATEVFTGLMLFAHEEVMLHGLAAIINLLLFVIGFYAISSDDLIYEAYKVAKVITVLTLVLCIISFLLKPFLEAFPELNDAIIFGHKFNFKNVAFTNYRWNGYGRHPNQTGMICAGGIISSFILFLLTNKKSEVFLSIINLCLNTTFLIIVSSRSPLLASGTFIISFLVYYLINGGARKNYIIRKKLTILIIATIIFLIGVFLIAMISAPVKDYIIYKIIRVEDIETATGRTELQKKTLDSFIEKGQFLKGISYTYIDEVTDGYGPHNTFVEILAAIGIPSFVMLVLSFTIPFIYLLILIYKRKELSDSELLLTAIGFGIIISTIIQNSFEVAYIWELRGSSAIERWLICFPIIVWYNHKRSNLTR